MQHNMKKVGSHSKDNELMAEENKMMKTRGRKDKRYSQSSFDAC